MGRSQHTFSKRQREKDKAKKKKEKREKMEERKQVKAETDDGGIEIDWDLAPENKTLSKKEEDKKEQIEKKYQDDWSPAYSSLDPIGQRHPGFFCFT